MGATTKKVKVIAYLDPEKSQALQAYAKRQHRPVSAQIAFLVDQALEVEKGQTS